MTDGHFLGELETDLCLSYANSGRKVSIIPLDGTISSTLLYDFECERPG